VTETSAVKRKGVSAYVPVLYTSGLCLYKAVNLGGTAGLNFSSFDTRSFFILLLIYILGG
jgi:hypothetical protein